MTTHRRFSSYFLYAAVIAAAQLVMPSADAQQRPSEKSVGLGPAGAPDGYYTQRGPSGAGGGYPLTFSWIWGPAKMPPAPTDFGPHFDFPTGYSLNGVPDRSPYPD